jgi:hypothetical protein
MAQTTCRECNAQYNSERELRDHRARAHRRFGSAAGKSSPHDKKAATPADRHAK